MTIATAPRTIRDDGGAAAGDAIPAGPLTRRQLPFSVVAKPTGAACNLDCQYCFFLSKELLYATKRQQMNEETLATYVAEYLAASPDGEVTMLWQGGEPTLRGLPFFRTLVKLCERYRRPGQHVVHAMQTNGTLIDEEWAEFLKANDVLVGVSIDGPEPYHDAYRLNRAGRGTHAMVIRGWNILRQAGVRCNVLCTVHHANEEHGLVVYRYFRDELGADFMQFIPIVERVDPSQLERAEHDGWRATGGCSCRTSMRPSARCLGNTPCACMRPNAGTTSRLNSTATSTPATIGSSRIGSSAMCSRRTSTRWRTARSCAASPGKSASS